MIIIDNLLDYEKDVIGLKTKIWVNNIIIINKI